jgi:hypothetical protein
MQGSGSNVPPFPRRLIAFALVVLAIVGASSWVRSDLRYDHEVFARLNSPDPEHRKQGAWLVAERGTPKTVQWLADQLLGGTETSTDVRESYVHSLGRAGDDQLFPLVTRLITDDPEPYVRQAAWLAAARLRPIEFRLFAANHEPLATPWDRIGWAYAWLETGDPRGVAELLHWAAAGDYDQRRVACLALNRNLAPLIEAAGRWPAEFDLRDETKPWPPELVAEIERRCVGLDLAGLAADWQVQQARAAPIRRNVGKLTSVRETIARSLFAHN